MAKKIRINLRKDYREQLRLYLNLSKSLNAKIKKLFNKTARQAEKEYIEFGDMYYFFLEHLLWLLINNRSRGIDHDPRPQAYESCALTN